MFDQLTTEALTAFDRIVGLDLDVVAIDGSLHKAPYGGEGTAKSPVDRAKLGWKWSVASERSGIPIGWAIDGAHRNDVKLLEPTLDAITERGLLADIGTVALDRSYDYPKIRTQLHNRGLVELDIQRRGTKPPPGTPPRLTSNCQMLWMRSDRQAATGSSGLGWVSGFLSWCWPSMKTAPARTRAARCGALMRRQRSWAASRSL